MLNTSITLGYTSTLDPKTHNPIQKTLEPCMDVADALTEIISYVDNGSQRDLDRVDELAKQIMSKVVKKSCTDAVSREEALKEMQKYYDDCATTSEYTRLGFETAMNVVKELPPVTPERPKGEWLSELKLYGEGKDKYECSICHRTITVDPLHESLRDYPFCHCGADMRGVQE